MKKMYQCKMRNGTFETVGWIEARGAKVGAQVELLPSHGLWTVIEVFKHGLPENVIKQQQIQSRSYAKEKGAQ